MDSCTIWDKGTNFHQQKQTPYLALSSRTLLLLAKLNCKQQLLLRLVSMCSYLKVKWLPKGK